MTKRAEARRLADVCAAASLDEAVAAVTRRVRQHADLLARCRALDARCRALHARVARLRAPEGSGAGRDGLGREDSGRNGGGRDGTPHANDDQAPTASADATAPGHGSGTGGAGE